MTVDLFDSSPFCYGSANIHTIYGCFQSPLPDRASNLGEKSDPSAKTRITRATVRIGAHKTHAKSRLDEAAGHGVH